MNIKSARERQTEKGGKKEGEYGGKQLSICSKKAFGERRWDKDIVNGWHTFIQSNGPVSHFLFHVDKVVEGEVVRVHFHDTTSRVNHWVLVGITNSEI